MQNAADAAAIGAEMEWERGAGDQDAQGQADAALNGFTNGVNNVTVTIYGPPPIGEYSNRYDAQYVRITQTVNTIFMGALNGGKATVSVSSVALMPACGYITSSAGILNAFSLDITNTQGISSQGMFSRCPLYINKGVYLAASVGLDEYAINATGSVSQTALLGSFYPAPTYASLSVNDPLASVAQPTVSACSHTSFSVTSGSASLNPGTYCGTALNPGIKLSGGGNIWLNPGLYVITGGFHATDVNLGGNGVTLFFTKGSGSVPYGQVIFDGDSQVDINAPSVSSGGAISTILFFTDRNWVHTSPQDFQLNDAEYYGSGIWYVNGTGLQLTAGSSTWSPGYLSVIADSIYIDSSTLNLFSNFSTVNTGPVSIGTGLPNPANPFRTKAVLVQ
jgi:hypothetical protein